MSPDQKLHTAESASNASAPPEPKLPAESGLSRFRRLAPLILVAGVAIVTTSLMPYVPREHQVELRLEDSKTIVGVSVDWTDLRDASLSSRTSAGDDNDTRVLGTSWRFETGTAPRSLAMTVRLPNGPYDVDIRVDRTQERVQTTRRSVTLGDADRISLPVR